MPAHSETFDLTIFLPVFNEQEIIVRNTERIFDYLSSLNFSFEIVIGSNGSTDQTPAFGRELQARHPQVRFFHLTEKGPGAAFRRAVETLCSERLICLDMDLPVPLDFISEAARLLEDHDIVIGSKKAGVENRSLLRRLGSGLFIFGAQRLLKLPYDDYSMGAKAYRKTVLRRYQKTIDTGSSYTERIIYWASRDGFRVVQIPVQCHDERKSRFNLIHQAVYRFKGLWQLWRSQGR